MSVNEPPANEALSNEVLSMFFDDGFVPHDYLDALFSSSLNLANPSMKNKSTEFASARSLRSLQNKCLSLLTHLDYYTNELTRQFERKLEDLHNSSSIISYSSSTTEAGSKGAAGTSTVGITRLEYYVKNLSSSINSLNRDLDEVKAKMTGIEPDPQSQQLIDEFQKLKAVRERIEAVLYIFETVQAIVTTSQLEEEKLQQATSPMAPTNTSAAEPEINVTVDVFGASLSILEETILEQIQKERGASEPNAQLVEKIQLMVDLLPFFKNLSVFYPVYQQFVGFLEGERKRYLGRFK